MLHPYTLHRRINAIREALGYDGGIALTPPHRLALRAEGAGFSLVTARYRIASIYRPCRGDGVPSLVWWQKAMRGERVRAHDAIRAAGAVLAAVEREMETATLEAMEQSP